MDYREIIYRRYAEKFQASGYQRADVAMQWARAYRWFFRDWLPGNRGAAIIDAGCGGGQMLQMLAKLGYANCEGVDLSDQQAEKARRAGLRVHQGNAIDFLRRDAGRWDVILAIDILEHLHKDEALEFIQLAHGALKPGGRLILQMPNPDGFSGMRVRYGDLTHEIAVGPDCARRLLALFGYVDVEVRETGPVPGMQSPLASMRWVLWQCVRLVFMGIDLIETGGFGPKIFTRVYLVSALRPVSDQ